MTGHWLIAALVTTMAVAACDSFTLPREETRAVRTTIVEDVSATRSRDEQPAGAPRPGDSQVLRFSVAGWQTDFTRHSIPLDEITPGGPPRDGIPPLDNPRFESVTEADQWLHPLQPVVLIEIDENARAYPTQILNRHEIVNDDIGGTPIVVTFCPLCNTAIAFERRLGERVLDFGTTGNLRLSNLIMWDRQTESWWQQITGEAIVGELTGQRLSMIPALVISWSEFRSRFPSGQVLSRETGFPFGYAHNGYLGYDRLETPPFISGPQLDRRLSPLERVATVSQAGENVAYPFSLLRERGVVADTVGGEPIVIFYQPGTLSAHDEPNFVLMGDVGATAVFRADVLGRRLAFEWRDGAFVDAETGSRWSLLGRAIEGPLAGHRLAPVTHGTHFWFAWSAFKETTRIYGEKDGKP
ncbi:MAG TPA: DUF3179 domain-containing protein [Chloroflexota bacterium]|nr:DUF3179 domain-containing protein [Chloroflexota bacterium]